MDGRCAEYIAGGNDAGSDGRSLRWPSASYAAPVMDRGSTSAAIRLFSACARFAICAYWPEDAAVASVRCSSLFNPCAVSVAGALVIGCSTDGAGPASGTSVTAACGRADAGAD